MEGVSHCITSIQGVEGRCRLGGQDVPLREQLGMEITIIGERTTFMGISRVEA